MSPSSQLTRTLCAIFTLILSFSASLSTTPNLTHARTPVLEAGFADTRIANLDEATDFAILPDQRILVAVQSGRVYIIQNGNVLPTPALDLSAQTCDNWERGLSAIEIDPNFAQNRYIYLYYTYRAQVKKTDCETSLKPVNRLSRFTLNAANVIDPNSETVLIDAILSVMANHNGGALRFGGDGYLYLGVGDSGTGGQLAQNLGELSGKILRIAPDGSIPPTNPYAATANARRCGNPNAPQNGTGPCQEIFAYGLRNPWRLSFKPNSSQFFIHDVGQGAWEEINDGIANANYGWPMREGECKKDSFTDCATQPNLNNPIHSYSHRNGCSGITGGAFVPTTAWVSPFQGNYLFADIVCGRIYTLIPGPAGFHADLFGYDLGAIVSMRFNAADNALYYLTYNYYQGTHGELHRIDYVGNANLAPQVSANAAPSYGPAPLTVQFTANASDANQDPLRYIWRFGDNSTYVVSTAAAISHTYAANGVYTASVTALDAANEASQVFEMRVDVGNSPPNLAFVNEAIPAAYAVKQAIHLQANASDAEDGAVPADALLWRVLLHHVDQNNPQNSHSHPYIAPTKGTRLSFTMPPPEDLDAVQSDLEVQLTATDSQGLAQTITRTLQPQRVEITLATQPSGLSLLLNSRVITTPHTFTSWANYSLSLRAPDTQFTNSQTAIFARWANGAANTHVFNTPNQDATLTAHYALLPQTLDKRVWLAVLRDR